MPFNIDAAHVDVAIRYRHSVPICSLAAIAGVDIARSRELARGSLATARPRRRAAVPRALSDAAPGRGERFLRHGRSAVRPLVESFADDGRAALPPDAPAGVRTSGDVQSGETGGSLATATTACCGVHSSTSRVWAAAGSPTGSTLASCSEQMWWPRWAATASVSLASSGCGQFGHSGRSCDVATSRRPAGPARVRFELLWCKGTAERGLT